MKKLFVSLLSLPAVIFGVVSAIDVKQEGKVYINVNSSTSLSSCNADESHDKYYYIPSNDNITIYPDDTYWNSNDAFIRKDSSVEIFRNGVISECDTWQRMSNIVRGGLVNPPQYPALIFRNDDGCVLNKPNYLKNEGNKATAVDAQIHYTVKINLIGGGEGSGKAKNKGQFFYNNGEGSYACYPDWEPVESASSCTESSAYYRVEPDKHVGECLNYRVFWCGDGLINRPDGSKNYDNGTYSEECDPNDSEWVNGKEGQTCNPSTCKIEYTLASCGSLDVNSPKYNESHPDPRITKDSEGLCEVGNLEAGSFSYDSKTGKYTWKCVNGNSNSISCSAQDKWCGDGEVTATKEECDPEHPDYKGKGTCNNNCKLEEPLCNSEYNNKKAYQKPENLYLKGTELLCNLGIAQNFWKGGVPLKFTWSCENLTKNPAQCTFNQYRCGDGEINGGGDWSDFINGSHYEACDPEHPDYKGKGTCNDDCSYASAICGTASSSTPVYNQSYPNSRIKESDMCKTGKLVAGSFKYDSTTGKYTWKCVNGTAESELCVAQDLWCGDGKVTNEEQCDIADTRDPSVKGWGEGTLKNCVACKLQTLDGPACNSQYNKQTKYQSISLGEWLKNPMIPSLCTNGTVDNFKSDGKSPRTFTWECKANGVSESCIAHQERCGDGKLDKNKEKCDPADSTHEGWGDGCSTTCQPTYNAGVCGSKYNGQTKYQDISNPRLNEKIPGLCDKGIVTSFESHPSSHIFTWQCDNHGNISEQCRADQEWCGDGKKQEKETCDPKDSAQEGWGDGCSATCEKVYGDAVCGSKYNGQTKYQDIRNEWLNKSTTGLCDKGEVIEFLLDRTTGKYTWKCENGTKISGLCVAQQEWCGDGVQNGKEQCDPKDPNETNWGNDGCSQSCEKKNQISDKCDATFHYTLRYLWEYTFYDKFDPKGTTRYLYGFDVKFIEKNPYDYNQGENPSFIWMPNLGSGVYKEVTTSGRVIKSTPRYPVKDHPTIEDSGDDDIYIEYDIKYSDKAYPTKPDDSKLKTHKECAYYRISWCGDGKLDTDWEGKKPEDKAEECDPGSEGTKVLPDGRICNSDCKIENPPKPKDGTLKIEKTLQNKKEVTKTGEILTWDVRVRAEGGDVTNFRIDDIVPFALEYKNYTGFKNDDKLTISGPTGPVKTDTGNVYTWDVTGTLKNGHELILQITTEVVKMPRSQDDYRNVACVIKDSTKECDDDQPGSRRVEKTLIGSKEVKTTGDLVTWSLKLIVDKGEIKNPVIRDVLPPVLGYKSGSYIVVHNPGLTISKPTTGTTTTGGQKLEEIVWKTDGTVKAGEYVEIQLTTYAKVMPDKEYKNVLCVKPDGEEEECDPEPIGPNLRIKKYHLNADGTTTKNEKTVKIGDEVPYKIMFGNNGTSSATITSIKDFLPKNLQYLTGTIFINRNSEHKTGTTTTGGEMIDVLRGEKLTNGFKIVDGVHIEIYGGMTLEPGDTGYIILTGKVLETNLDNRVNYACIYLNDKKIDCDDVTYKVDSLICSKEDFKISTTTFSYVGGSTDVSCGTSPKGTKADTIMIDCGSGSTGTRYYTGSNISSLTGKCTYPQNSSTSQVKYTVQCKVNNVDSSDCKGDVTVDIYSSPGCFPVGTKVIMADGTQKNIEDVEEGDVVLSYNVATNENEGNVVKKRLVHEDNVHEMYELNINSDVLKVTDVHPFYVRETENSRDYAWIEAQNLKVGDILLMSDGNLVKIEKINHYPNKETVYNLEIGGNHDYFVDKGYLVHNKGGSPSCDKITTNPDVTTSLTSGKDIEVTCSATDKSYILIDCNYKAGNKYDDSNNNFFVSTGRVTTFTGICKNYTQNSKIQCLIKEYESSSWQSPKDSCGKNVTIGGGGGCFPVGTKVIMADGTKKDINEVREGDRVLSYNTYTNTNEESMVKQRIVHEDNIHEMYELTINSDILKVTDVHPFYVRESENSRDYTWIEAQNLKVGDILLMSDGNLVKIEKINHYPNKETVYNLEVEGNHDYFVDEGYLVHNKGSSSSGTPNPPQPDKLYDAVNCFNVNAGNASIEQGETLPFYWNIEKLSKAISGGVFSGTSSTGAFSGTATVYMSGQFIEYELGKYPYGNESNYKNIQKVSCSSGQDGAIALNSMICSFKITDGRGKVVIAKSYPCLQAKTKEISPALVKAWAEWSRNKYTIGTNGKKKMWTLDTYQDTNYSFRTNVNYIKDFGLKYQDGTDIDIFGEYKISLTEVAYLQCQNGNWVEGKEIPIECQSDFVLTNPYTVQKTPSGNLKASTEELRSYLYMNGKSVEYISNLLRAVAVSEYSPNDAVNDAMNKFINKYSKLAVNAGNELKKVPGKNIYFISSNICLGSECKNPVVKIDKPTTFVQTAGDTTIKGNLDSNLMLLTKGKIMFDGSDKNGGSYSCKHRQVVKGIFYSAGTPLGIERTNVQKNKLLSNSARCTEGGLTIKGVLIGNGLKEMMNDSRSNLNNWFDEDKGGKNAQTVMNGASVLIEYSPSVFTKSTMPPGAEDFTTALSIYKN